MKHLEEATAAAVAEQKRLNVEIEALEDALRESQNTCQGLAGRLGALELELEKSRKRGDHYLRWATEITKQLHNVGMFVSDALQLARQEVAKASPGDGAVLKVAEAALEAELSIQ